MVFFFWLGKGRERRPGKARRTPNSGERVKPWKVNRSNKNKVAQPLYFFHGVIPPKKLFLVFFVVLSLAVGLGLKKKLMFFCAFK